MNPWKTSLVLGNKMPQNAQAASGKIKLALQIQPLSYTWRENGGFEELLDNVLAIS